MTRSRIWTLGTAVVVVVILVAGWFLLVSPTRADAADIEAQTASQEQQNVQLASRIEQLKVQAQDLPAQEAKLAEFRQKIPVAPQLPSFIRQLSSIAGESKVVLVSLEPQTPAALTVAETTPAPATQGTEDGAGDVTLNTAPTSTVQYIQAQVTVRGGYFNTEQFLSKMERLDRAFLVTGFDIVALDDPEASPGDVETHLQVRVYFASDLTAVASAPAPSTAVNN